MRHRTGGGKVSGEVPDEKWWVTAHQLQRGGRGGKKDRARKTTGMRGTEKAGFPR